MSPKGEGFKLMGFWGAGGPFLVLKTSEVNLRLSEPLTILRFLLPLIHV